MNSKVSANIRYYREKPTPLQGTKKGQNKKNDDFEYFDDPSITNRLNLSIHQQSTLKTAMNYDKRHPIVRKLNAVIEIKWFLIVVKA